MVTFTLFACLPYRKELGLKGMGTMNLFYSQ